MNLHKSIQKMTTFPAIRWADVLLYACGRVS